MKMHQTCDVASADLALPYRKCCLEAGEGFVLARRDVLCCEGPTAAVPQAEEDLQSQKEEAAAASPTLPEIGEPAEIPPMPPGRPYVHLMSL